MCSGLMMKDVDWSHMVLTIKEERICFEWIKLFKNWMGLELGR